MSLNLTIDLTYKTLFCLSHYWFCEHIWKPHIHTIHYIQKKNRQHWSNTDSTGWYVLAFMFIPLFGMTSCWITPYADIKPSGRERASPASPDKNFRHAYNIAEWNPSGLSMNTKCPPCGTLMISQGTFMSLRACCAPV